MNVLRSAVFLARGIGCNACRVAVTQRAGFAALAPRAAGGWVVSRGEGPARGVTLGRSHAEGAGIFMTVPWQQQQQQVRTVKRGTEYQPKNIKRIRTHGWKKRTSTPGGIMVILRRMLKGRKSLTH
ncbi:hypothetical protein AAFF_G00266550 [Aldrovandia affinis]|uniref:Large ribosomal subunit protein bL34m n=1 Tax=Aldrovandia affinis TaxID=143900 RepID=A0AAD7RB84_9TELE|nr:hypothetical protein AAFF_G00266550 [Aldrovandia affinis]